MTRLTDEITKGEADLEDREESLIKMFAKLESLMTQYSSWASSLSGIISSSSE